MLVLLVLLLAVLLMIRIFMTMDDDVNDSR